MWDWFIGFLSNVLAAIAGVVGDWGLAIIILTFIVRLALTPLTIRSTKSSARMQVLQPKLQEIQNRYADDPERQAAELRKFYSENSFNPLGGCLPVLLQMPIFFALFNVLRNHIPADARFYNLIDPLSESCSEVVASGDASKAIIFVILVALFGILTFIPMILNNGSVADPDQRRMSYGMGGMTALMMMWFGWSVPAGVLLYYNVSSIWGVVQQLFITTRVRESAMREAEAAAANAPIEVDVVRRERAKRPHKKS